MNQGMVKQNFFERSELLFWNLAIHVLSSTRSMRAALSPVLSAASRSKAGPLGAVIALSGMAGLVSGCLFFVITH